MEKGLSLSAPAYKRRLRIDNVKLQPRFELFMAIELGDTLTGIQRTLCSRNARLDEIILTY